MTLGHIILAIAILILYGICVKHYLKCYNISYDDRTESQDWIIAVFWIFTVGIIMTLCSLTWKIPINTLL